MSTPKKSKAAKAKAARTKQKAQPKKSTPAAGRTTRKVSKAKAPKSRKASTKGPRAPEHKGRDEIRVEAAPAGNGFDQVTAGIEAILRPQESQTTVMSSGADAGRLVYVANDQGPAFDVGAAAEDAPGFTSLLPWIIAMLIGMAFMVWVCLHLLRSLGLLP